MMINMIKCVCILGNGVVEKGKIYYLKRDAHSESYDHYCIMDSDMKFLRNTTVMSKDIPKGFMRIEEHREKIIDSLINN